MDISVHHAPVAILTESLNFEPGVVCSTGGSYGLIIILDSPKCTFITTPAMGILNSVPLDVGDAFLLWGEPDSFSLRERSENRYLHLYTPAASPNHHV